MFQGKTEDSRVCGPRCLEQGSELGAAPDVPGRTPVKEELAVTVVKHRSLLDALTGLG